MSAIIREPPTLLSSQSELSLTGVEVTFLKKRPKTKIKLTIELNGEEREVESSVNGPAVWKGEIRCRIEAKIVIHTYSRNHFRRWKKFASAEISLQEDSLPVFDDQKQIKVILTVSKSRNDSTPLGDAMKAVDAAKERLDNTLVIIEKLGKIWDVLKFVDSIGESLKDIHPAVGIAMTAVSSLVKLCEKQQACRDEASHLVEELMSFLSIKAYEDKLRKRAETRRAVHVMLVLISEASNYICEKTRTGFGGIIGDLIGSEYKEQISGLQKQFVRAKESFDRSVQLEIFAAVDGIALDTQLSILDTNLLPCKDAHFRPGDGCLDGTRANLRRRALNWIENDDPSQPNVFWLFGNAGTGKSTVANSVAKMVDPDRGYQLSCFFCKRDSSDLSNPRKLLPTLAYRFAQQHESYRALILDLIRDGVRGAGLATTADITTQFVRLFEEPLVKTLKPPRLHVVVIDAFDECGSSEDQGQLAMYLLNLARAAPWIKIFITSRDEPKIHKIFSRASDCIAHDISDETGVDGDIRLYIESRAAELDLRLSCDDVEELGKQADGLFIWCRTLFEYLRDGIGTRHFLNQLLSGKGTQDSRPWRQLYKLYDNILESALGSQALDAVLFMRGLLSVVNIAASTRPLSAKAVTSFLHGHESHKRFDVEDAEKIVKSLHSVLFVDRTANDAIRARHASFYDFLQWKANTNAESGWGTQGEIHRLIAQGCLKTLHEELKYNICKIETPVLNKDILDLTARILANISEKLQYSSRYWFTHLTPSTLTAAEVEVPVSELLHSKKLLFWLECSSLLGYLRQLRFTFRVCMQKFFQPCPAIIAAAEDACRFVSSFADAMDSIPHIYLSALLWLPEDSLTYKNLGLPRRSNWHLIKNKKTSWDALVWKSEQINALSVAFSPDSRFVAYGTDDGTVYIRDSQTGVLEGKPFRGHQKAVRSVAYSPDGLRIASGSRDNTVTIWDVKTSEAIFTSLDGHSDRVRCVAFSPDGLFVASGSDDCTVRIWNTRTGKLEGEPLQHSGWVRAVGYSPNGQFIASACDDHHVHVWDTTSYHEATMPFQGHQGWVLSIAYSPGGSIIVSGSADSTIRTWNAQTGEPVGEPIQGHTDWVESVMYSSDGRVILSGSHDGTVRLWDAASSDPIAESLHTKVNCLSYSADGSLIASASVDGVHVWDTSTCFASGHRVQGLTVREDPQAPAVYAVSYSPDDLLTASGSEDDQIRIWNVQTGTPVNHPSIKHPATRQGGSVRSMAYSRDGRFIVSGSADDDNSSVCILDVRTSAIVCGPLEGHSNSIYSVAYSPDGRVVASASSDNTVRLWDVQTSAVINEPLEVGSHALSIAFSPDGHLLACGTCDEFIYIWDTDTTTYVRDPIQAHSDDINSVAFSPDGCRIASGSDDRSVRIWDAQTGEALGGPLHGHQNYVFCVAYSPDGRFLASSSSSELFIWDTQNGTVYRKLQGPSTDIHPVTYSHNGRFLASGAGNGRVYVHDVSTNDHDHTEATWISSCSQLDIQNGWAKDGETLLLWVPVPYRERIRFCARFQIPRPVSDVVSAYSIDYRTLFKYSGTRRMDIFAGFDSQDISYAG